MLNGTGRVLAIGVALDLTHDPSGIGMELAQIIAASPEWQPLRLRQASDGATSP